MRQLPPSPAPQHQNIGHEQVNYPAAKYQLLKFQYLPQPLDVDRKREYVKYKTPLHVNTDCKCVNYSLWLLDIDTR